MKMAHTCIRVKGLEASIEFCQKAFGFEESHRYDFPGGKPILVYLTLLGDDYELELAYSYDHGAYDSGNGHGHIATAADDLEKLHGQHRATGLEITNLKGLPGAAPSYYSVIDPDSYKIEIIRG